LISRNPGTGMAIDAGAERRRSEAFEPKRKAHNPAFQGLRRRAMSAGLFGPTNLPSTFADLHADENSRLRQILRDFSA